MSWKFARLLPDPLKTSTLRSTLSAKPFDAAGEEAVPQPELRKAFKFDHCFIVSICEINNSKRTDRCSVYAEPSKFIVEASKLAEEQLLSPAAFIHCQSRGQSQKSDKDGTADHQESSHMVAGQCATPRVDGAIYFEEQL